MVITIYRPWEKKFSSVGWRTRLLLEEKKLKYETRLVLLQMQEQLSEEILHLNPRGRLPILQDVDAVLHEESSMLHYLHEFYPEPSLMPDKENRKEYAKALVTFHEATGVFANVVRPALNALLKKDPNEIDKNKVKTWKNNISKELYRWEKLLASTNSDYLLGKTISLCDIAFFPYLAHLVRYGFQLKKSFPRLHGYYERMCNRPSVKKTWPGGWKSEEAIQWFNME